MIKQLCAETMWLYYLFPSNMRVATKRDRIAMCWGLQNHRNVLTDSALDGAGSSGAAYFTYMWLEFRFLVTMMVDWFSSPGNQQETLSKEPWECAQWLDNREFAPGRMLRHVILYLLFPEWFEPIATASHKRQIVRKLYQGDSSVDFNNRTELDRAVLTIRRRLEKQFPDIEVNYYRSPIKELWQPGAITPPTTIEPDTYKLSDEGVAAWFRRRFAESSRVWWLSAGTGGHL